MCICAEWWQEDAIFHPAFPHFKQRQLDTGLPLQQGVKAASLLTILGLWLLVASLASHYKEILKNSARR